MARINDLIDDSGYSAAYLRGRVDGMLEQLKDLNKTTTELRDTVTELRVKVAALESQVTRLKRDSDERRRQWMVFITFILAPLIGGLIGSTIAGLMQR